MIDFLQASDSFMHPAYAAADTDPNSMSTAQSTFCGAICTREERADDEKSGGGGVGGGEWVSVRGEEEGCESGCGGRGGGSINCVSYFIERQWRTRCCV